MPSIEAVINWNWLEGLRAMADMGKVWLAAFVFLEEVGGDNVETTCPVMLEYILTDAETTTKKYLETIFNSVLKRNYHRHLLSIF